MGYGKRFQFSFFCKWSADIVFIINLVTVINCLKFVLSIDVQEIFLHLFSIHLELILRAPLWINLFKGNLICNRIQDWKRGNSRVTKKHLLHQFKTFGFFIWSIFWATESPELSLAENQKKTLTLPLFCYFNQIYQSFAK